MTMTQAPAAPAGVRPGAPGHHPRAAGAGHHVRVRGGRRQPGDAQRGARARRRDALPDRRRRHAHRGDRRHGRRRHLERRPRGQPPPHGRRPRLRRRPPPLRVRRVDGGLRRRPVPAGAGLRRRASPRCTSPSAMPTPPTSARKVFSLFATAWVVPSIAGPFIAGALVDLFGWRSVFLVVAGFAAFSTIAVRAPMGRRLAVRTAPLVWGRRPLYAVVAAAGVVALHLAGHGAGLGSAVLLLLGLAVVAVAAGPLLPRGTTRAARGLPAVIASRGLFGASFACVEMFLPLVLQRESGMSPTVSGLVMMVGALGWVAGSAYAGKHGRPDTFPRILRAGQPRPPRRHRRLARAGPGRPLPARRRDRRDDRLLHHGRGHGPGHAADVDARARPRSRGTPGRQRCRDPDERLARPEHRGRPGRSGVRALVPDRRAHVVPLRLRPRPPARPRRDRDRPPQRRLAWVVEEAEESTAVLESRSDPVVSRPSRRLLRNLLRNQRKATSLLNHRSLVRTADRTAPSWPSPAPRGSSAARSRRS